MDDLVQHEAVQITIDSDTVLDGDLNMPETARGIVLFAHGSGSSRHSPRNQFVANILNQAGLATLLLDLLTPDEEAVDRVTRYLHFDIGMLAQRLAKTVDWLIQQDTTHSLNIGLFGSSTGAGAALVASTLRANHIRAVISRGGRPDLAGEALAEVQAPTLLIVGGDDAPVIELNQQAMRQLHSTNHLEIVPGASHLFEEPGTLERVTQLARAWFLTYLDVTEAPQG
jgi:putative phosphoribosyl transferase